MKLKLVCTWSPEERKLRLFRLVGGQASAGKGGGRYSWKLTFALVLRLFRIERAGNYCRLTIAGICVHWAKSYGGAFV